MNKIKILALLLLLSTTIQSQKTIIGHVSDSTNATPVAFANCILVQATDSTFLQGTITDIDGHFRIDNIPSGNYLLRISAIGYRTLYLTPSYNKSVAIQLHTESTTLGEIAVVANKPLYSADGEKTLYHVSDDPSVQTGTAMEVLQNAPGVEVDAAGNISLRGSTQVAVWLNDRPSNLDGEALKQYLKAMPASNIKRVEVITNPSARYGSSATAIVNIITEQRMTRNELLCVGLNAAATPTLSPWLSYVWANERVSVNTWLNGTYGAFDVDVSNHETILDADGTLSAERGYSGLAHQRSGNGNGGVSIEWMVDSLTSLSLWAGGYPGGNNEQDEYNTQYIEHIYAPGNYSYRSNTDSRYRYWGAYGGLYLQHRLDTAGQRIDVSLNSNYFSDRNNTDNERLYEELHQLDMLHHTEKSSSSLWTNIDINYVKPYSSTGQVELGGGAVLGRNTEGRQWDTLDHTANLLRRDADHTYSELTHDNEASLFATVQQRFGQLVLKGGVRAYRKWKNADYSDLPTPTTDYDVHKAFWDFIPSLHASYGTPSGHNFTLSYTRRFNAPGATLWSTYENLDKESYSIGNPSLRFSHTHNLEGGWAWYQAWGSLSLSAYMRANSDEISQLSDVVYHPYFGHVVECSQWRNIGSSSTTGAEANLTLRPKPFVNVRLYTTLYDYSYRIEYRPSEWQDTSMLSFAARLNVWAKVWKEWQLFANANYNSGSLQLMSTSAPNFTLDLGVSADLFDRQLSLFLTVNDVLHTNRYAGASINPYYTTNYTYSYNSRTVSLGLTWRIGKMELESKARQGGSSTQSPM